MKKIFNSHMRYIYFFILLVAAIVFSFSIKQLFFYDEDIFVVNTSSDFFNQIGQRSFVGKLTYLANNFLFNTSAYGYHFTNILFHLANAVLGVLVITQIVKICSSFISPFQLKTIPLIFLLLFLCSPIHSEPLCYILARDGMLVAFFCLLSIFLFIKADFKNKGLITMSLLSFLIALFTYEISWPLPLIILCITIFISYVKNTALKKYLLYTIPYFIFFIVWFIVKIVVVSKFEVTDYKDEQLFAITPIVFIKNGVLLFLRNFIVPYKSANTFIISSVVFITLLIAAFLKLYKTKKQLFFLVMLLAVLVFLGYAAAILLGIDTHDSESERYIYFSSCFAIMLLAIVITVLINNKLVLGLVSFCLIGFYAINLHTTIGYYKNAGKFAQQYLSAINSIDKPNVFFVNLPAQYNGALLFRAKSRLGRNTKNNITVINEYMQYLHLNNTSTYVALSTLQMQTVPLKLQTYHLPLDSVGLYFPQQKIDFNSTNIVTANGEQFNFIKSKVAIVAYKDSTLYIFK
jgi:hypothetical protein